MIPLRSTTYFERKNDFVSFYDSSQIGISSTFSELENTDFKREMLFVGTCTIFDVFIKKFDKLIHQTFFT